MRLRGPASDEAGAQGARRRPSAGVAACATLIAALYACQAPPPPTAPRQSGYLKASNPGVAAGLGISVAVDRDVLVVGAYRERSATAGVNAGPGLDEDAIFAGAVYVFRRQGASWAQEAYIKPSDVKPNAFFGRAVAVDGDVIAVGAYGDYEGILDSGAVYVFRRVDGAWIEEAHFRPSNAKKADEFGIAVALAGDTLAVGARKESSAARGIGPPGADKAADEAGAVYLYERTSGGWVETAYFKGHNTRLGDHFGTAVALRGDALVVGAPREDSLPGHDVVSDEVRLTNSGAAYVFRRDGAGGWYQEGFLKADNAATMNLFGRSVTIDGDVIAVGADEESRGIVDEDGDGAPDAAPRAGAAYVFRRDADGTWRQEAYLKGSNTAAGDQFGASVELRGELLAVGAIWEDGGAGGVDGDQGDDGMLDSGAVYLFRRDDRGWRQTSYLKAAVPGPNAWFGRALGIDRGRLIVGASGESSAAPGIDGDEHDSSAPGSGAVYVFELNR